MRRNATDATAFPEAVVTSGYALVRPESLVRSSVALQPLRDRYPLVLSAVVFRPRTQQAPSAVYAIRNVGDKPVNLMLRSRP